MKFIVDAMLGRTSRWLRMLGFEAKYVKASDDDLLDLTKKENRILLTSDLELSQRARSRGLDTFYVTGKDEPEKLAKITQHFNIKLEIDINSSRCPKCGSSITSIEKKDVSTQVPKGSLMYHNSFWVCTGCGKIYWQGKHWEKINEMLTQVKELQITNDHITTL